MPLLLLAAQGGQHNLLTQECWNWPSVLGLALLCSRLEFCRRLLYPWQLGAYLAMPVAFS